MVTRLPVTNSKNMKIILFQDIPKVGKKYEVKNVKDGYGRNFLLPRKLAELATPGNLKNLETRKKAEEERKKKLEEKLNQSLKNLESKEIVVSARANEEGELYGSVGAAEIAEELKKQGFEIPEGHIQLEEKIKKTGEHEIELKIGETETKFRLKVISE